MWVSKRVYKEKIGKILTLTKVAAMEAAEKDSKKIQETKSNENMNALQNFRNKTRRHVITMEEKDICYKTANSGKHSATTVEKQGT